MPEVAASCYVLLTTQFFRFSWSQFWLPGMSAELRSRALFLDVCLLSCRHRAKLDPGRAFNRLQARLLQASINLRELKDQQRDWLRQYVLYAVRGGTTSPAPSRSSELSAPTIKPGDGSSSLQAQSCRDLVQQEESFPNSPSDSDNLQRTLGPNGVFRVSASDPSAIHALCMYCCRYAW